jgi:phosphoglycerol transferase MdoB-like AlkP superfamily enzyme
MKKIEIILGGITLAALAAHLLGVPHVWIVLALSTLLLMNLYFYLGFAIYLDIPLKKLFNKSAYAGLSPLRVIGSVALGWTLSLIVTGLFFSVQHYPGARLIISAGSGLLLIISLIVFIKYKKTTAPFYRNMLYRCELYMAVALGLLLLL